MNFFRDWDYLLWASALGLVLMSAVAMVSATAALNPALAVRHLFWIAAGFVVSWIVAQFSYRRFLELTPMIYVLALLVLLLVHWIGAVRLGASRWLSVFGFSLQPSEFAKLATVALLAQTLSGQLRPLPLGRLAFSAILVGLPAILVLTQPDLGSATVFGAIWIGVAWVAGLSRRSSIVLLLAGLIAMPVGWHFLHGYQRDRLLVFLNPQIDPLGAGFSIIQSTIAIGSGQLWGRGWFAGTQNQLSFLPERHSDFLFSVIGEEWGFLGCLFVVGLFGLLLTRIVRLAMLSSDPNARLFAVGIFSWVGYQACVNMGMVMGLLPVVGVPLPMVSYGGSSMVTLWFALGLLQSIYRSER
ncbi:MAG: rod shape-determining protein RodA [Candidatus Omnitrophica bacterium]|nr:rod shape-determining protein RodA [Candidatus Omnitrophota bacterium]